VSSVLEAVNNQQRPKASSVRREFLGASVDSLSMDEAIGRVQGFIASGSPHLVVALNVPKLWRMQRDARLKRIVERAEMILPEQVITLAARLCGTSLKAYIGNDRLTEALLPLCARRGYRLFFLGTQRTLLERMLSGLREQSPGIVIAGFHDGFFTDEEAETVAEEIRHSQSDILFVGMGTPRQEYWMESFGRRVNVPVVIGVGGTLDVLAGVKHHCPNWLRTVGLEWSYRLLEDPCGKFKRYSFALPWFVRALIVKGIISRWFLTQNVGRN
jgi:N-acetylglucosaminyldiphosphoundecaprenol N-acetyl-beta-D-mannosaminyltransferase